MQLAFRLPYLRLSLQTSLAPDEARRALGAQLSDVPFYKSAGGKDFRGRVEGDRFSCARVIPYRNVFRPVVRGRLVPEAAGTRVDLLMLPPVFGAVFLSLWTLGVLAVLVGGAVAGRGHAPGASFWLLTLPISVLGIAIAGFAFGSEALEAERLLKRCLRVSPG